MPYFFSFLLGALPLQIVDFAVTTQTLWSMHLLYEQEHHLESIPNLTKFMLVGQLASKYLHSSTEKVK